MPLECKITTGMENEQMQAGLGIKVELCDGALKVTKILSEGQCAKGGVKLGSMIVGIDGTPLNECFKEVTADAFATEVKKRAESGDKDHHAYVLNVDGFPEGVEDDGDFRKLLKGGLVAKKRHEHGAMNGGNVVDALFNGNKAGRILFHDEKDNKLKVVKKKGDKTDKAMKLTEITNVSVNEKNRKEMVIESQNGVKLQLQTHSEMATEAIVKKLHKSCSIEQEREDGPVVLRDPQLTPP